MRVCSSIPADRSAALTSQPTGTLPALRDGTTPSSLSRTRERNSPRKRNANAKHKRKRSFTPRVKSYRVETLFHRVRTTSEEHTGWLLSPKLESSPSTFDPNRFVSLAAVAPRRLSRVAFHASPSTRTLTTRLTVSVAHLRSISLVIVPRPSVRGALTTERNRVASPSLVKVSFSSRTFGHSEVFDGSIGHFVCENPKKKYD